MNFRVYVIIEAPLLDKSFELLIPADKRIHEIITILKNNITDFTKNYYSINEPNLYNKFNGTLYDMNTFIKDSNIKDGTRLLLM